MMINWAEDKPCSQMSTRKIARKINKYFKKYEIMDESGKKILSVRHTTVNAYTNKFLEKPRKIRKNFFLSEKQMEKRVQFCNEILKKNITGQDIFFSDETQIDLCNYTNDYIRFSKTNQKKIKNGELDVYELITRPVKKFEKSIMVAGGISSKGVGRLNDHDGNQNEFCYAQALLYYKGCV